MQNFYEFGLAGLLAVRLALLPLYALRLFSHIAGRSTKTIEQLLKHPKRCTCACHICPKRIQNSKNPTLQLHWLDAYNLPGLCHSICVLESLPEPHILSEPTAALAQVVRHHLRNKITFWGLGDWTIRSAVPNIQLWEIALFGNNTWRRTKLGTPNPRNRGTLEKRKIFYVYIKKTSSSEISKVVKGVLLKVPSGLMPSRNKERVFENCPFKITDHVLMAEFVKGTIFGRPRAWIVCMEKLSRNWGFSLSCWPIPARISNWPGTSTLLAPLTIFLQLV